MLIVLLHLSMIRVFLNDLLLMVEKKNQLSKCLYHNSKWNLTASNFLLAALLK